MVEKRIMDTRHQTNRASTFTSESIISRMPDKVVSNILNRLPLQEAVRTAVLSRNWRFKWTLLTRLIFDEEFYEYLFITKNKDSYVRIISRIINHLKGSIYTFYLYIEENRYSKFSVEIIERWISLLSKKGIKSLHIRKNTTPLVVLPTNLFSCLELEHLSLAFCRFDPPIGFNGFPNLLNLEFIPVNSETRNLGEFLSRCPMLVKLDMFFLNSAIRIKIDEIAKLANLEELALLVRHLDPTITSSSTIFELLGSLPKLDELDLHFTGCYFTRCKFTEDDAKKRISTTFPCLNTLRLHSIDLGVDANFSYAFEMIRSSPNLQSLVIRTDWDLTERSEICSPEVDYNTMETLKLQDVMFEGFYGSKNEVCMIKYILVCSPLLKKIDIKLDSRVSPFDRFLLATEILKIYRASPVGRINLC